MNIIKIKSTGYAPTIKSEEDVKLFNIITEYPERNKCESTSLSTMLHVFPVSDLIKGFKGELDNNVWYRLATKDGGVEVDNWKHVFKDLFHL